MAREKGMGSLQLEKSGRYTARICVNGLRICRSTRTKDRKQAEVYLMKLLAPFGRGEKRLALADVWRMYEKSPKRRDLAPATIVAKRGVWLHFATWMEENHPEVVQLKQLSQEIVGEYLRVLRIDHCASTYNNRVCVLREVCRVLADDAGVVEDPWEGVRLRVDDSHSRRELSLDELQRLLKAAKKAKGEWLLLFVIGIYTGLRLGDCCRLMWNSVNLEKGIIQLIPRKTKRHAHGRPITIPIHPELQAMLLSKVKNEGEDYVLPEMADAYLTHKWYVTNGVAKIFKAANITMSVKLEGRRTKTPEATFHSLRHTFVSLAANAGVPLHIVQSIVGHESTAMTRHYYHENEEVLRKAVAAIPSIAEMRKESAADSVQEKPAAPSLDPTKLAELADLYSRLKSIFGDSP